MATQRGALPQINFSKGWLTEINQLDYPDNFIQAGDNIEIELTGDVRRRLAIGAEPSFAYSSTLSKSTTLPYKIQKFYWANPTGLGTFDFVVFRFGNLLYFYEASTNSISSKLKSFTVNLNTYKAISSADLTTQEVQFASDTKRLFICGISLEPIYVEYNATLDTISVVQTTLEIRDFEDADPDTANDAELATLTGAQEYDLVNRGWYSPGSGIADPKATYRSSKSVYPPKSKAPWQGKNTTNDFDVAFLAKVFAGNSSSAKGHFIFNYFNRDRTVISGIAGITAEVITNRPQAVFFYAGRSWYAYGNELLYSQVIQAAEDIGRCYQENDPTSEELSDLLDSDGGLLPVKGASRIKAGGQVGNHLIILDEEGVWAISGADGIFKATGFSINKISNEGIASASSVVDFKNGISYWGRNGIFIVSLDNLGNPVVQSISEGKIDDEYGKITSYAKDTVSGTYDRFRKELVWSYNNDQFVDTTKHQYSTHILKFKVSTGAFIPPMSIPQTNDYPMVVETFGTKLPSYRQRTETVTVGGVAVTVSGVPVTVEIDQVDNPQLGLKFFVLVQDGSNIKWAIGEMNDASFLDFKDFDATGTNYVSYLEPGFKTFTDVFTEKRCPVIYSFFKRTETDFSLSGGNYILNNPSGCTLQGKWDWADADSSNRWTNEIVAYRFTRPYTVDPATLAFNYGTSIIQTKSKLRGKGKSLKIRYTSTTGKDFQLAGWGMLVDKDTNV
jgi:hypothetical protein